MHAPLYEPELYKLSMSRGECAYLTSTPEELMRSYSDYRYRQQKADEITLETTRLIESEPLVRAIFAGHMHYDYEGRLLCGLPQYVTGSGSARWSFLFLKATIAIIPAPQSIIMASITI
jgi:hypothetical protein